MGHSVTLLERIACAAVIIPMHSAWKTVLWAANCVEMYMLRSSENIPEPVPDLVLDSSVTLLGKALLGGPRTVRHRAIISSISLNIA